MLLDLLWLLLPVAAASGWMVARRRPVPPKLRTLQDSHYFTGLNHLLNEQPDQAIEVFVQMVEVDGDALETQLALGKLFRQRGEMDRAIRIHQSLVARPSLTETQRGAAMLELGNDYLRAGLLDRAERLFTELSETSSHRGLALERLVTVFEREREWCRAIETASDLLRHGKSSYAPRLAQFHCEEAEQQAGSGSRMAAARSLHNALRIDPNCVRANLALGTLAMAGGEFAEALSFFHAVEDQDADFLAEVLEPMRACYQTQGQMDEFSHFLHGIAARRPRVGAIQMLALLERDQCGVKVAEARLEEHLRRHPSLNGLSLLLEWRMEGLDAGTSEVLRPLKAVCSELVAEQAHYACRSCGLRSKRLEWQCPGCHGWSTIRPVGG